MSNNPLFFLLLGLMVAWIGSYFYSIQYNRTKLRRLALWLKEALPLLGSPATSRYQGADRLNIMVPSGRGNIREAALVLGLQSRQLFRLLFSTLRGGRDSLTLLVSLHKAPAEGQEFEIFEARGPLPQSVLAADGTYKAFEVVEYSRNPAYRLAYRSAAAQETAYRVLTLLLDDGYNVRRFSLRPNAPHLMLVLNVGVVPQSEAAPLLRLVKNLAEEVSRPVKVTPPPSDTPSRPSKSSRTVPGSRLPGKAAAPTAGFDGGLTSTKRHTTNGHHPKNSE